MSAFDICRVAVSTRNSAPVIVVAERAFSGDDVDRPGNVARNPRAGLIINDAAGVERFGLGLQDSGRLVMGLDAPLGKGDDRNRERITLVAGESGGSYIRFLDRTTSIPARLYLDDQNRVWLEFIGAQANEIVRRRIGLIAEHRIGFSVFSSHTKDGSTGGSICRSRSIAD